MQLASKNRFIAVQFQAMLKNHLWQKLAQYTNDLAKRFEQEVKSVPGISTAHPVQTNSVFLTMSPSIYEKMHQHFHFYYWNDLKNEVRLVFSFDNTVDEILEFVQLLKEYTRE
jgi:threonine aldolase